MADRLLVSSADGSRSVTDAVGVTYEIARIGCALENISPPPRPRTVLVFILSFLVRFRDSRLTESSRQSVVRALCGTWKDNSSLGTRSLAIEFEGVGRNAFARVATRTFMSVKEAEETHYALMASPTLFPGQSVRATFKADAGNPAAVTCKLYLSVYGGDDSMEIRLGPAIELHPGQSDQLLWTIDEMGGCPIAHIGIEVTAQDEISGKIYLDALDWQGVPDATFRRPDGTGQMWLRAWVNAVEEAGTRWPEAFHLSESRGPGLFILGGSTWRDYAVTSVITPRVARSFGLAARVRGLLRYYAFLLTSGKTARIVKRAR